MDQEQIIVGLAQIAPVWLDRVRTSEKIIDYINKAAVKGCHLVTFGEALLPGYPFWIEKTDGARFDSKVQKELHAWYTKQAIQVKAGHLDSICKTAADKNISVILGTIERAEDRGGHSLYCSRIYIDDSGKILSVHRKLMPTYEERLSWSPGDGHGLQVHKLGPFTVGSLNCWENWMPLARTALYGLGEDLHVAIWPGGIQNTQDITRFIAKESRSFVISVSGLMRKSDIQSHVPYSDEIIERSNKIMANGGSCISGPDGNWVLEPQADTEDIFVAMIDHDRVKEERHNFDPSGHYSRPDITRLVVNRIRQNIIEIKD